MRLDWRRFSSLDWAGFAGAERFADGCDPFIAEAEVDGAAAIAVFDRDGLHVIAHVLEDGDASTFTYRDEGHDVLALAMPRELTTETLRAIGFTEGF